MRHETRRTRPSPSFAQSLGAGAVALSLVVLAGCGGDDGDDGDDARNAAAGSSTPPAVSASAPAPAASGASPGADPSGQPSAASGPSSSAPASGAPMASAAPTATPTAARSAGEPTRAQLETAARAINLRAGDLPGYTASPAEPDDDSDEASEEAFFACLGFAKASDEDGVESPDFERGEDLPSLSWSSSVSRDVPARQVGSVRAFATDRGVACFRPFFAAALREAEDDDLQVTDAKVVRLPVRAPGADAAAGVRATAVLRTQGVAVPFTIDFVVLAERGLAATLSAIGVGQAPSAAQRAALVQTVSQRLVANAP